MPLQFEAPSSPSGRKSPLTRGSTISFSSNSPQGSPKLKGSKPSLISRNTTHFEENEDDDVPSLGRLGRSKSLMGTLGEVGCSSIPLFSREELSPALIRMCALIVRDRASRLPRSPSEMRVARHRMPRSSADLLLRTGMSMSRVCEDEAMRVCERWARKLRGHVHDGTLPEVLAYFAHARVEVYFNPDADPDTDKADPLVPPGPLARALRCIVPTQARAAMEGWDFVDDTLQAMDLEEKLDPTSLLVSPNRPRKQGPPASKMVLAIGRAPPVWAPGPSCSDFSRAGFMEEADELRFSAGGGLVRRRSLASGFRGTGLPCGGDLTDKVPGPGSYEAMAHELSRAVWSPRRGEFPSIGRQRAKCTAMSLYHREREL